MAVPFMDDTLHKVKNRLWWELLFLTLGVSSAIYTFQNIEPEARKLHALDCPIAGTVNGNFRITGTAHRADGTDAVLKSRLNSSNVVYYRLEQKALVDGKWTTAPTLTDSVPYLLRDPSGDLTVRRGNVVNAFSREVERMNVRQRQAMVMVEEPTTAIGAISIASDGTRHFDGNITPSRFYSNSTNVFVLMAKYFVYINAFFFLVTLAADYRSSRHGRGMQTAVCLLATALLAISFELCVYREGHKSLLDEYNGVYGQLVVSESQMPRGAWILGVDAYNEHAGVLAAEAESFPNNLSTWIFGLQVPRLIER